MEFWEEVGDGAGTRVMTCEMCTEHVRCAQNMTRSGVAGKGSYREGCRGVEHGQTSTKNHTSPVAVRAALESAVQLGRGDGVKPKGPTIRNQGCHVGVHNAGIRYSLAPRAAIAMHRLRTDMLNVATLNSILLHDMNASCS
jgi:hypothetical protein